MNAKRFVKRKSTGARVARGIVLMTLLSTLSIGIFSYYIYKKDAMDRYSETAADIAIAVASSIEFESFSESVEKEETDEYWDTVKLFLDKLKTGTNVQYLYILTLEADGAFRYYCEGIKPSDNPEDIGEFGYVEYNPDVFGIEALTAMETKSPQTAPPYYSDGYGYMVSGFAPVLDNEGRAAGVVGVDISVSEVQAAANRFALYIAAAAVIFSIVFAYISKRYIQGLIGLSVRRISEGTRQLADGILIFTAREQDDSDDIGRLYSNFSKVTSTFKMLIEDMKHMSEMHAKGEYETRLDESKYTGAYLEVVKGVNSMTFMYVDNFRELLNVVQNYGNGDFHANVRKYPGKLSKGNEIVDELRLNLTDVNAEIMKLAEVALSGDLSARADSGRFKGDWSKIMANLNSLIEAIVVPIQEAADVLHKMAQGDLGVKVLGEYKGDFSLIKDNLNDTINELDFYIKEIGMVLRAVSQNDLTVGVSRSFVGDFALIENEIHSIVRAQDKFFREVGQVAEQLSGSASQVAAAGGKMSEGASEQHETIASLIQSIATVNEQTLENAKNAEAADKISVTSMQNATNGSREMENMLNSMKSIKESSNNIASIMKVIDDIAFQTNLLALNAAVEAARAGVHGKGFAVVAGEVRSLATKSLQAAKQTQELIDDTISRVNGGAETAQSTAMALSVICENVSAVSELISKISHSSKEQANAVMFIKEGIEHISEIVETNADMARENDAASNDLADEATSLNRLFGSVKLAENS